MIYCCSIENYIKTFFANELNNIILCYETAASYLGLANEDGFPLIFQHTIPGNINSNYMDGIYMKEIDKRDTKVINGIICTNEERTICELIKQNRDIQCILESLNKYMHKNQSMYKLETKAKKYDIEDELKEFMEDALEYYND